MSIIQSPLSNSLPLPQSAGSSHVSTGAVRPQATAAKVGHEFESVFASAMLKEMRQSLEPGSLFGSDSGDVYGGLFDRFMGEQMTKGGGLGMARMVEASIEKLQNAGLPGSQQALPASPASSMPAAATVATQAITG